MYGTTLVYTPDIQKHFKMIKSQVQQRHFYISEFWWRKTKRLKHSLKKIDSDHSKYVSQKSQMIRMKPFELFLKNQLMITQISINNFWTALALGTPDHELKQRFHWLSHCRTDTLIRAYEDDIISLLDDPNMTNEAFQDYLDLISICHPPKAK